MCAIDEEAVARLEASMPKTNIIAGTGGIVRSPRSRPVVVP